MDNSTHNFINFSGNWFLYKRTLLKAKKTYVHTHPPSEWQTRSRASLLQTQTSNHILSTVVIGKRTSNVQIQLSTRTSIFHSICMTWVHFHHRDNWFVSAVSFSLSLLNFLNSKQPFYVEFQRVFKIEIFFNLNLLWQMISLLIFLTYFVYSTLVRVTVALFQKEYFQQQKNHLNIKLWQKKNI